jgi:hypothetical protein
MRPLLQATGDETADLSRRHAVVEDADTRVLTVAGGKLTTYRRIALSALERLRPEHVFEVGEAVGAAAFAILAMAGMIVAGAFLANVIPQGDSSAFGHLLSAGTVPLLNVLVGLEVASSFIVLLAAFFKQALAIRGGASPQGTVDRGGDR